MYSMYKTKDKTYGWYIIAGCAVICGCNIGVLSNTAGVFLKPVSEELGVSRGQIALYSSLFSLIGMCCAPVQGRLLEKYSLKRQMLAGALLAGICLFVYSLADSLSSFYLTAVVCGAAFGFSNLIPVNKVLANWFADKKGTAAGIALAGSGLMAMLVTPILSEIVSKYGWRMGYRFVGSLYLALMLPVILFVIKEKPPLEKEAVKKRMSAGKDGLELSRREAIKTKRFWEMLAALVLAGIVSLGIQQHLIAYFTDIGFSEAFASGIYSGCMGVLIAGKIILGRLYDKAGIEKTSVYICSMMILALTLLLIPQFACMPYLFVLAFGLANAMQSIPATCLASQFFGMKEYTSIYGICNAGNMAGIAMGTSVSAYIYDIAGSYRPAWCLYILICAVILFLYMAANKDYERAKEAVCLPKMNIKRE